MPHPRSPRNRSRQRPPTVTVRVAAPADVPEIRRLAIEVQRYHHERRPDLFTPEGTDTPDEILERIASPVDEYWVATDGGAVVGYAYAHWGDRPGNRWHHSQRVLELRQMGVAAAWRGHGVGRALWDGVRERAEAESAVRIEVMVWDFNREAVSFYERIGLTRFHTRMAIDLDDGAAPGGGK